RSGGDDHNLRFEVGLAARIFHTHLAGREETTLPGDHFDAVTSELRLHDVGLGFDHLVHAEAEVGHVDPLFDVIVDAVDALILEAREMQHGLAHGFAGDGTGVDANSTDDFALFDQHGFTAAFRALNCRPLSRRARANDNKIVGTHAG